MQFYRTQHRMLCSSNDTFSLKQNQNWGFQEEKISILTIRITVLDSIMNKLLEDLSFVLR